MTEAASTKERNFLRWSEWSEPSAPVMLPTAEQYFAGNVEPVSTRKMQLGGRTVYGSSDAPSAKMVTSQFDQHLKARVSMLMDVTEGSVLSHAEKSVDVIDPITLEIKEYTKKPIGLADDDEDEEVKDESIEPIELYSSTTVIGIVGGDELTIVEDGELITPGVFLIYDQNGELVVTEEVNDQESYRIHSFAEERGE